MNLRYLLDEHLRGRFWRAAEMHNRRGFHTLDLVRVGDPLDLPLGKPDPDVLLWAECEGRILVSEDRTSMLTYFQKHVQAGNHSPGLFLLRPLVPITDIIDFLVIAAYASDADEWLDVWRYIP
jgi:hypothetical protein